MQNLLDDLKHLLIADERLVVEGKLMKNKIIELGLALDKGLLKLLLSNSTIKKHFFEEVSGTMVFDKIKFMKFISNKEFLPDSYTSFKNKIGLTVEDEFITEGKEVVLSFPYKDCYLEGGQTKEDENRKEHFWNETLAPDDIDRLLEPKVLTAFKKYDSKGESDVKDIHKNQNFIVKGNNLLVLNTLKKLYSEKVKLIYIDPPYNTGNDSFKYNDSFTHSSWLTFMKNRLEVAKSFLQNDGVILVQIDNSPSTFEESPELGYLLVLMDEVFGRNNYVTTFIWKKKGNPSNTEKNIGTITESILMYAKNINYLAPNIQNYKRIYNFNENDKEYNLEFPVKTNEGTYERTTMMFGIVTPEGTFHPPKGKRWTIGEDTAKQIVTEKRYVIDEGKFKIKKFSEDYKRGDAKLYNNLLLEHGSLKSAKDELNDLGFNRELFGSPKPEILIKTLIEITTNKDDLVLDYHLGSGTTAAVAHKLNRRYIGIEQMDYINTLTIERLKKVIAGEKGGISKDVKWTGGGEFIFCELSELNNSFISKIKNANSSNKLLEILMEIKSLPYSNFKLLTEEVQNNVNEFSNLQMEAQKQVLMDILDKNMLYIPLSEIDNDDYSEIITKEIKKLNKNFFKKS
jgi:adenine-specific DNA-methyltransferase